MLGLIIKNTGSNIVIFITKLVIAFIMTPIFIKNLGNYDYGIWEVIGSVIGYMGMLDIGLRPTASRFAALYKAKDDQASLIKVYSTAQLFMFAVGMFLFLFMVLWAFLNPGILAPVQSDTEKYTLLLLIIGIQLIFVFPGLIAESFLEGFQKYHLKNLVTFINSIIGSSLLYYLIEPGNALVLLALINACGLSIKYIIYIYLLSRPQNGRIKFNIKYANKETFKEIVVFGLKSLIQGIAGRIATGSNSIIIAYFLGPALVVYYAIPAHLAGQATTARMLLTHTFMPLFSNLYGRNNQEDLQNWFLTGTRIVTGIMIAVIAGILLLGKDFIRLWLGVEYAEEGALVLYILCLINLLTAINPLYSRYLTAVGRHGFLAKIGILSAAADLPLSIILVYLFGITGVVIGSLIPALITFPIILRYTCKCVGISVMTYIKECIIPLSIPSIVIIASIIVSKYYLCIDNYLTLIYVALIGSISYLACFISMTLKKEEKDLIFVRIRSLMGGVL